MPSHEFEALSVGVAYASVCTCLTTDEAAKRLNVEYPTGIKSQWELSKDPTFAGGQPNGVDCPDHKGNKHYLFNC